ncbi:hypothetical protein [Kibdelosporangium aridum]|uniref:hypothetical protein n=1 Tax=Kibdelosporangium aridum TaxID=2030 RepID=UPI0035E6D396
MTRTKWASSGLCVLLVPALFGCGGNADSPGSTSESPSTENPVQTPASVPATTPETPKGGAPGGPAGGKPGGGAQGAPITIPAFTVLAGGDVQEMKSRVERKLRDEGCRDGNLCVTVRYVLASKNDDNCEIAKVRPEKTIRRGETLTVTISCSEKAGATDEETPSVEPEPGTPTPVPRSSS